MTKLSTTQVSERLSVPVSTVKLWADRLGIGERNSQGQRRFDDRDLAALDLVKSLRDTDCGFETITRRLSSAVGNGDPLDDNERQRGSTVTAVLDAEALAERLTQAVISATRADNELAEKYAHAAHRIGELEAEVRHLNEDRQRLLTAGQDQAGEVASLRAELAAERAKPWWHKLVGR